MLQLRVFPRWHSARSFPALFSAAITSCPATHFPALFFDVLPHLPRRLLILPSNKPWGDVGARNRQSHNDYKPVNRLKDLVPITSLYTVRQNSIGIIPYSHLEPALKIRKKSTKKIRYHLLFTPSKAKSSLFLRKVVRILKLIMEDKQGRHTRMRDTSSTIPKYKMGNFYKQTWQTLYKIFLVIRSFKVWNNGSQGGSLVSFTDSHLSHGTEADGWMNIKIITKRKWWQSVKRCHRFQFSKFNSRYNVLKSHWMEYNVSPPDGSCFWIFCPIVPMATSIGQYLISLITKQLHPFPA